MQDGNENVSKDQSWRTENKREFQKTIREY